MKPTLLRIERAPGDWPRAMEQLDGDLLVPLEARPFIERALLLAERGLTSDRLLELAAIDKARRILGIESQPAPADPAVANLLTVRAL